MWEPWSAMSASWDRMTNIWTELAFRPFETTQKLAELIWEAQGPQQEEASAYWHEAEAKVWEPNRKLVSDVAQSMWDTAGKPPEMDISFWVAAQKYVASLIALATSSRTSPDNLIEVFPPESYYHVVQDLAQAMYRRSDQPLMTPPLTFWLSAENVIQTMLAGAAAAAQNLQDSIQYLTKIPSST